MCRKVAFYILLLVTRSIYAPKLPLSAQESGTVTAAPNPDYRLGHELGFHSLSTRLLSLRTNRGGNIIIAIRQPDLFGRHNRLSTIAQDSKIAC